MPTGLITQLAQNSQWGFFKAGADLSAYYNCFVTISAADFTVNLATSGLIPVGVLISQAYSPSVAAAAGQAVRIAKPGDIFTIKVVAAYAVGTILMPDTGNSGKGMTWATPGYAGAQMLEASTAANDLVSCILLPPIYHS